MKNNKMAAEVGHPKFSTDICQKYTLYQYNMTEVLFVSDKAVGIATGYGWSNEGLEFESR
jgi:hypothetical protein